MNFRSLLINLYLNLKGNSEALSEGVTDLIRGTPRVLEYAPRTPRLQPPINRMRGFPKMLLISLLSLTILPRFPCPFKPEALVFLAQVPKVDFTPEIPENPEENPFPETKLCPVFHLAIFKLSSEFIPLLFKSFHVLEGNTSTIQVNVSFYKHKCNIYLLLFDTNILLYV